MSVKSGCEQTIKRWTFLLFCLIVLVGCAEKPSSIEEVDTPAAEEEAQPYLGLDFPTSIVSRFAPSIFRSEMHAPPIFTPDGREVYWSLMGDRGLKFMKIENGAWTEPAKASFDRSGRGDSPFITSDGTRLLYLSYGSNNEKIWQVEREDDGWGSPEVLPNEVNHNGAHWQASTADNGNLYFGSEGNLYFSLFENGAYSSAEIMEISLSLENGYDGSPFIAPDESYLIFDRGVDYSPVDLFITFRNEVGDWDEPVAMEELNSPGNDLYANVSPDGRFLIFLSNRSGGILLPYWVDASVIEDYRSQE